MLYKIDINVNRKTDVLVRYFHGTANKFNQFGVNRAALCNLCIFLRFNYNITVIRIVYGCPETNETLLKNSNTVKPKKHNWSISKIYHCQIICSLILKLLL